MDFDEYVLAPFAIASTGQMSNFTFWIIKKIDDMRKRRILNLSNVDDFGNKVKDSWMYNFRLRLQFVLHKAYAMRIS